MLWREYKFWITDDEYERLEEWYSRVTKGRTYHGAIGGELTFIFTPTSLGTRVEVEYVFDGEKLLLREIDD
jgi:hypothetical protein